MFKLYLYNITVFNSVLSYIFITLQCLTLNFSLVGSQWRMAGRQLSQLELYLNVLCHIITILCLL